MRELVVAVRQLRAASQIAACDHLEYPVAVDLEGRARRRAAPAVVERVDARHERPGAVVERSGAAPHEPRGSRGNPAPFRAFAAGAREARAREEGPLRARPRVQDLRIFWKRRGVGRPVGVVEDAVERGRERVLVLAPQGAARRHAQQQFAGGDGRRRDGGPLAADVVVAPAAQVDARMAGAAAGREPVREGGALVGDGRRRERVVLVLL